MWRVVIIDDEEKALKGMRKFIPWEELQCLWVGEAKNGKEGIEIVEKQKPDIIITDIYMPVMNGIEMIQELRNKGINSKVIILSGYNEFEHARRAMRLRIDDYLSKPASVETIRDVLKKLIDQLEQEKVEKLAYKELQERVKVYEPEARKAWLKSVITGTANIAEPPEAAKDVIDNWQRQNKRHVVVSITYDDKLENSSFYQSNWYLFRFAASNIISETTATIFVDFHYLELHSHQAVLCIHFRQELGEEAFEGLKELSYSIIDNITTFLGIQTEVSIGGIKNKWWEMNDSMKESLYSLSLIDGNNQNNKRIKVIPELNLVHSEPKSLWAQSMEANQKLAESIRYAEEQASCIVIEEFFSKIDQLHYNKSTAIRIGIEMWAVITYSLYDIGIRIHDMYGRDFDLYRDLTKMNSWMELSHYFKQQAKYICHHQQWNENIKHRQLVEQIMDYVHDHLSENIKLQDIADRFYISRNYLGQIFKTVVGESFKDYITRVRMEKAKKMLQEGELLVYEISEKVGYENSAYFTTLFKKYTGYAPRDLIKKKVMD